MNIKQHTPYIYPYIYCALLFCSGLMVPGEWYKLCFSSHLTCISIVVGSGWQCRLPCIFWKFDQNSIGIWQMWFWDIVCMHICSSFTPLGYCTHMRFMVMKWDFILEIHSIFQTMILDISVLADNMPTIIHRFYQLS